MQNAVEHEPQADSQRRRSSWRRVATLSAMGLVLLPYFYSRAASPFRRVMVFADSAIAESVPSQSAKQQLRVLTYNIAHGRGLAESNWAGGNAVQRRDRLEQIAQVLRDADAEVVVLNEVDFDCSWSHSVNQAEFLADLAGYRYRVEQRNLDFRVLCWTWKFGNAILSKLPVKNAKVIDIPGYSKTETLVAGQKRCVSVDVEWGGRPITVIGAHLCHRSEERRVESADVMVKNAQSSSRKTIIAGDLNSTAPGFPHAVIDAGNAISSLDASNLFRRHPTEAPTSLGEFTFRSGKTQTLIDWIIIPSTADFERYSVVNTDLSDHRPVWTDIRFDGSEQKQ